MNKLFEISHRISDHFHAFNLSFIVPIVLPEHDNIMNYSLFQKKPIYKHIKLTKENLNQKQRGLINN